MEETLDKDGNVKKKRIYKSFISNTPGPKGKREAEQMASEYAVEKESIYTHKNLPLGEYMDRYIESRSAVLSPSTIKEYKRCRKNDLSDLTCKPIMDITQGTEMEIPILLATLGPMRRGEICALDSAHVSGNIVHVEFPDYVIDRIKNTKGPITTLYPAQISNRFV